MTNSSEIMSNLMEWLVLRYGTSSGVYKLYKPGQIRFRIWNLEIFKNTGKRKQSDGGKK
jgi:hypothetical protein